MNHNSSHKQQGVAIIVVIFIVALMSVGAITLLEKKSTSAQTSALLQQQNLAYQHLHSVKSMITSVLLADKNISYDTEDEKWFSETNKLLGANFPVSDNPPVAIRGKLSFMDSLLNVNNYIKLNQRQVQIRTNPNFNTCLYKLALFEDTNITPINDTVVEYLNNKTPKQKLQSITELRYIPTLPLENYYKIKKHLFALDEVVKININTAPPYILECLHNDIDSFTAQTLASQTFKTIDNAKKALNSALPNLNITQISEYFDQIIAIKSTYFLLDLVITVAGKEFVGNVILKRENNKVTTVFQTLDFNIGS